MTLEKEDNFQWMTTKETANYLKISVGQLLNLTSRGVLPYYKLGRSNRYLKSELDSYLMSTRRSVIYVKDCSSSD